MKKQKKELNVRVSRIIGNMIENRNQLLKHVFDYNLGNNLIHIPVHFLRIMNNVQQPI